MFCILKIKPRRFTVHVRVRGYERAVKDDHKVSGLSDEKMGTSIYEDGKSNFMRSGVWACL